MSNSLEQHSTDHQHVAKGFEVFVGGLPRTVTENKIREVFSTCGEITEIRLMKDQQGNLKGFCFIRFARKEAADKAVQEKSGIKLDGKAIGVLPSTNQDTLFLGNLVKGWSASEFEKVVREVFPDVVSVDLAMSSSIDTKPGLKQQNRGFGFVKFSSHAAAARAYRVGTKPDFLLAGRLHPTVKWAEEEAGIDLNELAKIKIAFVRNIPVDGDETYLKKLFEPFGKVEKVVVVFKKGQPSVGFVHFSERADLDNAIKEMNGKIVEGPNGGVSFKLQVEVARPIDKSRKRAREDPQSVAPNKFLNSSKHLNDNVAFGSSAGLKAELQKEQELADPYENAVVSLPVVVKERLLRILRLGIATRFDIDIQCLTRLKELPEASAICVLDQFMLSGADQHDKGAYLAGLISKNRADKLRLNEVPSSLTRSRDVTSRESDLPSFSSRAHLPIVDPLPSQRGSTASKPDIHAPRYSSLFSDYPPSSRSALEKTEETSIARFHRHPTSTTAYGRDIIDSDFHRPPTSATVYGRDTVDFDFHRPPTFITADIREIVDSDFHGLPTSSTTYSRDIIDSEFHRPPASTVPYARDGIDSRFHHPETSTGHYARDEIDSRFQQPSTLTALYARDGIDSQFRRPTTSSVSYGRDGNDSHIADRQPTARPRLKFDPFTGLPYKFDPFTGEPILPESPPPRRHLGSPY